MNSLVNRTVILALTSLVVSCSAVAQSSDGMTLSQARRILTESTSAAWVQPSSVTYLRVVPTSVLFTEAGIEFDTTNTHGKPSGHFALTFAAVRSAKITGVVCSKGRRCDLATGDGNKLPPSVPRLLWNDTGSSCSSACEQQATQFVVALTRLAAFAEVAASPWHDFPARATEWRALPTKPPVPDAARVRSLLAEDALRDKNPKQALKYYLQGLELHPMWPQAWFNAALISGELRNFDNAAEYMQNYLLLAPDAPDASQARDQIEIWKIKAREK